MAAVAAADFADAPKSQISKSIDCGEKKLACSLSIKQQARPPHVKNRAKMGKGGRHSSMMSRIRVGFTDDIRGCGLTDSGGAAAAVAAPRRRPRALGPCRSRAGRDLGRGWAGSGLAEERVKEGHRLKGAHKTGGRSWLIHRVYSSLVTALPRPVPSLAASVTAAKRNARVPFARASALTTPCSEQARQGRHCPPSAGPASCGAGHVARDSVRGPSRPAALASIHPPASSLKTFMSRRSTPIQVAIRLRPLLLNPRANSKRIYYNYYTYCNPNSASNHIWI